MGIGTQRPLPGGDGVVGQQYLDTQPVAAAGLGGESNAADTDSSEPDVYSMLGVSPIINAAAVVAVRRELREAFCWAR